MILSILAAICLATMYVFCIVVATAFAAVLGYFAMTVILEMARQRRCRAHYARCQRFN